MIAGNVRLAAVPAILLDRDGAAASLDISVSSLEARVRDGTLPPPCMIGGLARWRVSELIERAHALPVTALMPASKRA